MNLFDITKTELLTYGEKLLLYFGYDRSIRSHLIESIDILNIEFPYTTEISKTDTLPSNNVLLLYIQNSIGESLVTSHTVNDLSQFGMNVFSIYFN